MPKRTKLPGHNYVPFAALLVVAVLWGVALPVIKLTTQYVTTFTFLYYRLLIVGIVLLPFTIWWLKKHPVHKRDWWNFFLLGLFSQTSLAIIFFGIRYTTALDGAIIGILTPLFAIYAGHHFFNERVNGWVKSGILIATIGMLFVVVSPALEATGNGGAAAWQRVMGNLLILAYNVVFMVYIVWSKSVAPGTHNVSKVLTDTLKWVHLKPMRRHYPPLLIAALTFYVGLATFIPLYVLEVAGVFGPPMETDFFKLSSIPVLGILYMALLSSIVAYFAFQWALSKVQVEDTAIFSYLTPVFTFPAAFLLLGEVPGQEIIVGSVIIAVGVIIAETKKT